MSETWEWLSGWVSHEVSVRMAAGTAVSTSGGPFTGWLFLIHRSHHQLQSPHDKQQVSPRMFPQYFMLFTFTFSLIFSRMPYRAFIPEQIKFRFMHCKWLLYLFVKNSPPTFSPVIYFPKGPGQMSSECYIFWICVIASSCWHKWMIHELF